MKHTKRELQEARDALKWLAKLALALVAVAVVILGPFVGWSLYRAHVQAAVYCRQGAQMSTWECWLGAKPVVRTFGTEENKGGK